MKRADDGAEPEDGRDGQGPRQVPRRQHDGEQDAEERKDRSDREVDPAGDDHQAQPEAEDAKGPHESGRVLQVGRRDEPRVERVIHMAQQNLRPLPGGNSTPLYVSDFRDLGYLEDMTIVCNPPYGVRMGDLQTLGHVYRMFGDFLKQRCKGSTAYIYCGTRELISDLGLKPAFKKPLVNGPLDGRLVKLELF